ncbi:unnamed protein product [Dibothriocephalus latus]|uniref:Uncharacterized protein n=1 Tax=Dibothriocephalus latus TaxID=60516 RepID=A0A3P7LPB0_DIBLA|nr:unnamed protein product [Dibothriocephalus latus]
MGVGVATPTAAAVAAMGNSEALKGGSTMTTATSKNLPSSAINGLTPSSCSPTTGNCSAAISTASTMSTAASASTYSTRVLDLKTGTVKKDGQSSVPPTDMLSILPRMLESDLCLRADNQRPRELHLSVFVRRCRTSDRVSSGLPTCQLRPSPLTHQLRWLGHVLRKPESEVGRNDTESETGRCKRRRRDG